MGNIRVGIDSPEVAATLQGRLAPLIGDDNGVLERLSNLLQGIGSGALDGKVRINAGAVQASNLVTFASFVATDTVTVNGVTITGSDTSSGQVQIRTGVSDEHTANSLRSVINANTTAKIAGVVTARRRATITCASVVTTDTVTINGVKFTVATSPTDGDAGSIAVGSSDSHMAEILMLAIKNHPHIDQGLITVTRAIGVLTINYYGSLVISSTGGTMTVASKIVVLDCLVPGTIGNLCTLAISAHGSVTGANFAGGTEGTEVVFDKNRSIR
jgi:hypothetical protein